MPCSRNWKLVLLTTAVLSFGSLARAQQETSWEDDFQTSAPPGQETFTSNCAGCHGLDGHGSEKAPNIANATVASMSDSTLMQIIRNGIEGSGMPAFRSLTPVQLQSVVDYLRMMQGKAKRQVAPGDGMKGKQIFFGKGACSMCHAISGRGGFLGPDLTEYGSSKSAAEVLRNLTNPKRIPQSGYRSVAVTTRAGDRVSGLLRNEDNFSLQLQTDDGSFRFFEKSELQKIEYPSESRMPSDYATRLSHQEFNDLISFLMSTGSASHSSQSSE